MSVSIIDTHDLDNFFTQAGWHPAQDQSGFYIICKCIHALDYNNLVELILSNDILSTVVDKSVNMAPILGATGYSEQ